MLEDIIDIIKFMFTDKEGRIVLLAIFLLIFGTGMITYFSNCNRRVEHNCTVTDKDVKQSKDNSKYLIFVKQNNTTEVYEITDSLIQGRFNSSDLYGSIEIGKTYDFTVVGSRIPIWSLYPNIMECKEVY